MWKLFCDNNMTDNDKTWEIGVWACWLACIWIRDGYFAALGNSQRQSWTLLIHVQEIKHKGFCFLCAKSYLVNISIFMFLMLRLILILEKPLCHMNVIYNTFVLAFHLHDRRAGFSTLYQVAEQFETAWFCRKWFSWSALNLISSVSLSIWWKVIQNASTCASESCTCS